jgi:hypothetical protein
MSIKFDNNAHCQDSNIIEKFGLLESCPFGIERKDKTPFIYGKTELNPDKVFQGSPECKQCKYFEKFEILNSNEINLYCNNPEKNLCTLQPGDIVYGLYSKNYNYNITKLTVKSNESSPRFPGYRVIQFEKVKSCLCVYINNYDVCSQTEDYRFIVSLSKEEIINERLKLIDSSIEECKESVTKNSNKIQNYEKLKHLKIEL